jgi:hypothetical protein
MILNYFTIKEKKDNLILSPSISNTNVVHIQWLRAPWLRQINKHLLNMVFFLYCMAKKKHIQHGQMFVRNI